MFQQVDLFSSGEKEGRHLYNWVFQTDLFLVIGPSLETAYKLD
jgi:hypothetical protein